MSLMYVGVASFLPSFLPDWSGHVMARFRMLTQSPIAMSRSIIGMLFAKPTPAKI
jgi:hypothetical protein